MTCSNAGKPPRIWTPVFVNVIFISLAVTSIVDALQAALPVHIENIGKSSTVGGLMVTVFAVAAIIPSLLAGVLADAFGCRRVMIAGAVIFAAGSFAPLLNGTVAALLFFRTVQGLGFAVLSVTAAAGASNILPPQRLGEGIGYFGVGQSLAMALGPMLGLELIAHGAIPMWSAVAAVSLLVLFASLFCFCDRRNNDGSPFERPRFSLRGIMERRAMLPAVMILIFSTGICSLIVFAGLYAKLRGYGNAGPFFIIAAAAMLAVRFASGLFMDKFHPLTILLPALTLGILTFLALAYIPGKYAFYAAGTLFGLSFGITMPLLSAVAVRRTPKQRWGAANATFYLCLNLGFGTGSLFGGLAIDLFGFHNTFLLGTLTAIVPAILGILFLKETKYGKTPAENSVQAE